MKSTIFIVRRDSEIFKELEGKDFCVSPGTIFILSDKGMKTLDDDFKVIQFEMDELPIVTVKE
jgi:hypothetical protein